MDWFHHPSYRAVCESVLADLKRKEHHFRKAGTVVFLCGGFQSPRRSRIREYLARNRPDCLNFYAEAAWLVVAESNPDANALEVERRLAQFADIVIIVVESPGTFAELGAFASSPDLRAKLLPILDSNHCDAESFINTGPVRWVDQESKFSPCIWGPHKRILEIAGQIEDRLDRIPTTHAKRVPSLRDSPKHLFLFICDIVAIFGPCSIEHIQFYISKVIDDPPSESESHLMIGLADAIDLLHSFNYAGTRLFYRPLENGRLPSFQYTKKYIHIPSLRAKILSVVQRVGSGGSVLNTMRQHFETG